MLALPRWANFERQIVKLSYPLRECIKILIVESCWGLPTDFLIEAQFYIQLVYQVPLSFTLRIKIWVVGYQKLFINILEKPKILI